MQVYVAGPLFSEAERSWLDALAARLRAEGVDCFVPHENFPELADVTLEQVYRIDTDGLRSSNALVAWLDGPMVDDGTACEIGMFAELVRSGGDHYRGIVAVATDLRLERRRQASVVGGGMNLFVGGAIASCGTIVHTVDEVVEALHALETQRPKDASFERQFWSAVRYALSFSMSKPCRPVPSLCSSSWEM